jgi:hypothetical protein
MLITRPALLHGAREVGVGVRVGERAFMLGSMLEQDATGTVRWLAREADRWVEHHRADEPAFGPVAAFWRTRAEASRDALRSLDPETAGVTAAPGHAGVPHA